MVRKFSKWGWWLVDHFGMKINDARTGEFLGRAWFFAFGRIIYVIGYHGEKPLVPVFLPQKKLSYWRLRLGFTTFEQPDYKNIRDDS